MASLVSSLLSFWTSPTPVESEECPLQVQAVPGLTTLLDVALFRTVEGQLTATLTTSHALLAAWLDFKQQSIAVIQEVTQEPNIGSRRPLVESFSRACLEAACDAIERLTTEKLSQTANLSDPYDYSSTTLSSTTSSGMSHHVFSGIATQGMLSALQESSQDTGRRIPLHQRRRDCWESPRLQCPDYTWADDVHQTCQRLLRQLFKHPYGGDSVENTVLSDSSRQRLSATTEREASLLLQILRTDLTARLSQFRAAMEAESVVSKRLYLVKCEYRAPFRAFLEGHQSVQRAPSVDLVQEYSNSPKSKVEQRRAAAKERLQKLLERPELVEALALEQECEEFETEMAKALYPFCELARFLDQKRARIKIVPGIVQKDDLIDFQETVRRLKGLLSRKAGPDTSSGIRPLLLDLQGVPRDEEQLSDAQISFKDKAVMERLDELILRLRTLGTLCKTRNAFRLEKKMDLDIPSSLVRGCTGFDYQLFRCQFQDWFSMAKRQNELTSKTQFEELAEKIRRAEMQMSLAVASDQSLEVVRQRLEMINQDREKRFEVLKEMVEEVCVREMNLFVQVSAPEKRKVLALNPTSAVGIFGQALQLAGEPLPIG